MPILSNERHELFAQNIAKGKSQKDAYIAAGYKARGASAESKAARLVRNGRVSARVRELAEEVKSEAIADAHEMQAFWTSIMRGEAVDQNSVVLEGEEIKQAATAAKMADRLKASELLGKSRAMFTDKIENSGGLRVEVVYVDAEGTP